ncbi:hypothetical protein LDENG_00154880 [Lucifuga dentata]|nr:hypothetical protein LDENG_00154880 [Lucifuga dentata]
MLAEELQQTDGAEDALGAHDDESVNSDDEIGYQNSVTAEGFYDAASEDVHSEADENGYPYSNIDEIFDNGQVWNAESTASYLFHTG